MTVASPSFSSFHQPHVRGRNILRDTPFAPLDEEIVLDVLSQRFPLEHKSVLFLFKLETPALREFLPLQFTVTERNAVGLDRRIKLVMLPGNKFFIVRPIRLSFHGILLSEMGMNPICFLYITTNSSCQTSPTHPLCLKVVGLKIQGGTLYEVLSS